MRGAQTVEVVQVLGVINQVLEKELAQLEECY